MEEVSTTIEKKDKKQNKKICHEKEERSKKQKNKQLHKFVDEQRKQRNGKKRNAYIIDDDDQEDDNSVTEETYETFATEVSSNLNSKKRNPSKRIQQLRSQKEAPKKSLDEYFAKFTHRQQSTQLSPSKNEAEDVNGFKVIGKITKEGITKVLWSFDWEGQKICEVQLKDGRKANMKREDLQRLCPEKLCEYLQKVVDFKQ